VKVEGWLFLGCGLFFGGVDIVYWYLSKDPTGTTALAITVGFAVLAAATTALGAAVGWWLFLIGLLSTVYATIGFVFEYYRGHFSH